MNVLHIAPHLGGGVGKAHAALAEAAMATPDGSIVRHTYALLEQPRDIVYIERLQAAGCILHVCPRPDQLALLATEADIVQLEWWNHPRLYETLVTNGLPDVRLAAWIHISGLVAPLIPSALLQIVDKTMFTSPCSYGAANLRSTILSRPEAFDFVNSGFAFSNEVRRQERRGKPLRFGYLGTMDFLKLHPNFFDFIDAIDTDISIRMWGRIDPKSEVVRRAASMRHPNRVVFEGYTDDPAAALSSLDVLIYLLNPEHYGTAENALVEAMSLGAVPIVFANPAEAYIVAHKKTGFIVESQDELATCIKEIIETPSQLDAMRRQANAYVARCRTPEHSAQILNNIYAELLREEKRPRNFKTALGPNAQTWFLSSLSAAPDDDLIGSRLLSHVAAKGSLGHFLSCCPLDPSLAALEQRAS